MEELLRFVLLVFYALSFVSAHEVSSTGYLIGLTVNLGSFPPVQRRAPDLLRHRRGDNVTARLAQFRDRTRAGSAVTPTGISKLDVNTGNVTLVETFADVYHCTETSYDDVEKTLYLLINGDTLTPYNVKKNVFLDAVQVDASNCDQGQPCFSEMRYDEKNKRLLAIGVGYPQGQGNSIVSIDPQSGEVKGLYQFSINCGVYLDSSTFDPDSQVFYAWLSCLDSQVVNEVVGIDLGKLQNFTVADTGLHDVYSPMTYLKGRKELVGVNGAQNNLVKLANNESTSVSSTLGGIPSENGIVVGHDAGAIVYASCQHFTDSVFSIANIDKGTVQILKNNYVLNYPHFVSVEGGVQ